MGMCFFSVAALVSCAVSCSALSMPAPTQASQLKKAALLSVLGASNVSDPVLCAPTTHADLFLRRRTTDTSSIPYAVTESGATFGATRTFLDLTLPEGSIRTEQQRLQTDTFRGATIPFLYERGWRSAFEASGFPGPDKEWREAEAHFLANGGSEGNLVDLSCGSGLITRRFTASGLYGRVIAADYSERMLSEAARRHQKENLPEFVRADVAMLPFKTGSIDAIHAGAALHCWPELEKSLLEVRRALRPGAGYYATTFLTDPMRGRPVQNGVGREGGATFRWFELDELRKLHLEAGFDTVEIRRSDPSCAVIKCVA